MQIIPVLDIKGGLVVRAVAGRRDLYRPIETPLSASADPLAVGEGLLRLHPFPCFYVADLDAIEGRPANLATVTRLAERLGVEIWLDAGFADEATLVAVLDHPRIRPVLGSESQSDAELLRRVHHHSRLILSLDFFADGYRGPSEMLERQDMWPETVIVMTLAKVGSGAGPDMDRLRAIGARAGERTVIAAGGVRGRDDLRLLSESAIGGALVATALHDGTLSPDAAGCFL